jgi:hypothetical protein
MTYVAAESEEVRSMLRPDATQRYSVVIQATGSRSDPGDGEGWLVVADASLSEHATINVTMACPFQGWTKTLDRSRTPDGEDSYVGRLVLSRYDVPFRLVCELDVEADGSVSEGDYVTWRIDASLVFGEPRVDAELDVDTMELEQQ